MRSYTLCAPGKWIIFVILSIQTCAFIGFGGWALLGNDPHGPPGLVAIFAIALPCFLWFKVLSTPHLITLEIDGTTTFISLLRSRRFHLREVESLRPAGNEFGFFTIDFGHGKQKFLAQFTGFHDFVARLKDANSTALILGC